MQTDDDAAEFAKLDKNKDGALDKTEAILEPRLLANFVAPPMHAETPGILRAFSFVQFSAGR